MHKLVVGELYIEGKTRWPEAVEYNYRGGQHELRIFLNNPSINDIETVRVGLLNFHLYKRSGVIFLVYEFHKMFSGGCAYSWHLVPEEDRILPTAKPLGVPPDQERDTIMITLVDARTGILHVIRVCTFSPRFTRALAAAIREQAAAPFDLDLHNQITNDEYSRRTPDEMIDISYISCKAGD